MSLSTFTSEPLRWWPLLARYAVLGTVLAAVLASFLVIVDPYDTGRLALFDGYGVPAFGQRLTAASVAREPQVEAATLGESTIQELDPVRLTALTGLRFVSLASAATGPIEQLAIAHWLVRHHDGLAGRPLKALVIGIDWKWCRGDGQLPIVNPFPFWLYADNPLTYVANLVQMASFGAAAHKVGLMLGRRQPLRADGYRDYDSASEWHTEEDLHQRHMQWFELFGSSDFAAAARLRQFLPEVPAQTVVILLILPRYYTSLPTPGSIDEQQYDACKAAYRGVAASRPRTVVLDFLKDDPMDHVDANFLDRAHYLRPVADRLEDAIAAAMLSEGGGE